ncbi:MAG: NUDIX domain-containing protein [Blautia marasmi]
MTFGKWEEKRWNSGIYVTAKGFLRGEPLKKAVTLGKGSTILRWRLGSSIGRRIPDPEESGRCQHYPNVWSLTAGRIQAGEDARGGCIREVKEEIGLALEREELIHLAHVNREDNSHMIWEVFLVRRDISVSGLTLDPDEVAEVRWVTKEKLEDMIRTEEIFTYPEIMDFFI